MRLAVCSSKGGVGKTSTAANLAVVLARRGRTLAVDADPQDSLGRAYGVVAKTSEDSLAGLLDGSGADPRAVVRRDVAPGLDLLPAHPAMEQVAVQLAARGGLASSLRRALRPLLADYDHVVIDTHGDLGNLTLAAVGAADAVLTVFTSDPGSALGAVRVAAFLDEHREFENTSAVLVGVACSAWDGAGTGGPRGRRCARGHRAAAAGDPGAGLAPRAQRRAGQAPGGAVGTVEPGRPGLRGAHRRSPGRLRREGGRMSDLLSDLQVDRGRSRAATPATVTAPPVTAPPVGAPPVTGVPVAGPAPSVTVRVTPLHWSLPGARREGAAWTLTGGPLRVVLALR